ncbi:MAG: ABC transporter substrate-binding protein, partial [Pseudomonadota bacterium]
GAAPVTTPPTEIYTSMERGVVDGFMWPNVGMVSFGLQEVTKYVLDPGVFQMEPATVIYMEKWKKSRRMFRT